MDPKALPATTTSGSRFDYAVETIVIPALIVCAVIALAIHLGLDGSWDIRNYHIYNAFALLHKAQGIDFIPAQLQSFLSPALDVAFYGVRVALNAHPNWVDAVLALPAAIATVIAFRIGLQLLPPSTPGSVLTRRWLLVLLALVFGATGAAGLPTIGMSMSEMPAACFLLAGLLLLLRALNQGPPWRWTTFGAGSLFGAAIGLKLTVAPFAVAATVACTLCLQGGLASRIAQLAALSTGGGLGALVFGGPWWMHLYLLTGNPIFPYFNNVFHSPWTNPAGMDDTRFLPHGLVQALFYPFYWGFQKTRLVSEPVLRDPRLAFASIALVAYTVQAVRRRAAPPRGRAGVCLVLFMAIGFALWEKQFSIFRYIAPVELLCGFMLLLVLQPLLARPRGAWIPFAALLVICSVTVPYTRYPSWGRAGANGLAASVVMPTLPKDSMILLLTGDPMSYIAAFNDPAIRFVGVNNNLVSPGDGTGLGKQVEAAVRAHAGPLWGLDMEHPDGPDPILAYYGLQRDGGCTAIVSNLEGAGLRICPLHRVPKG